VRLPFEVMCDRLAVYLGRNTARTALKTFAHKSAGVAPEKMTAEQAKLLLQALRPMLKTLLGAAKCEQLLAHMGIELDLRA
jgi:hypothetical protein